VLAVLCGAAGVVAANQRTPTYSATASVNVGRVDIRSEALPGYMSAAQSLAFSYSRVVTSDRIVAAIASSQHLSPQTVAGRLSAAPVPKSPIFTITGTGPSAAAAISLTNAATTQIRRFATSTSGGNGAATSILRDYRTQAAKTAQLRREVSRLKGNGSSAALTRAELSYQAAKLRLQGLGTQYQAQSAEVLSTAGIDVLDRPTAATNDRSKTVERFGAGGVIVGLLLGVALALALEQGRNRRRSRSG
jgi:uncharacterized protein involved in exopolysaccharide biosynthesis